MFPFNSKGNWETLRTGCDLDRAPCKSAKGVYAAVVTSAKRLAKTMKGIVWFLSRNFYLLRVRLKLDKRSLLHCHAGAALQKPSVARLSLIITVLDYYFAARENSFHNAFDFLSFISVVIHIHVARF